MTIFCYGICDWLACAELNFFLERRRVGVDPRGGPGQGGEGGMVVGVVAQETCP